MAMNTLHKAALLDLLERFSIPPPDSLERATLHSSGPVWEETEATYVQANRLLSEELRKGPLLQCIHITGVMKALSDPFHRSICRMASEKGRQFLVAGFVPDDTAANGAGVMTWLRRTWRATWADRLSAFSLMAKQQVYAVRLPALADLHFSLLNFRYVILQTEERETATKFVWLIESPALNGYLENRAAAHQASGIRLDPALFRNELLAVCSPTARETLWLLRENGPRGASQADPASLASLRAAGFVSDGESAKITNDGLVFLAEWMR